MEHLAKEAEFSATPTKELSLDNRANWLRMLMLIHLQQPIVCHKCHKEDNLVASEASWVEPLAKVQLILVQRKEDNLVCHSHKVVEVSAPILVKT